MPNFKVIHLYVARDKIFWLLIINQKIKSKGIYESVFETHNLEEYFKKRLKVKTLFFFKFKINISSCFYKIAILKNSKNYYSNNELEIVANSIFNKKYLKFNPGDYQLMVSKQYFGKQIVFLMLESFIFNFFKKIKSISVDFYFESLELLNFVNDSETKILYFNDFYYYEYDEGELNDISLINGGGSERYLNLAVQVPYDFNIKIKNQEDGLNFPKFSSLLCLK